MRKSDKIGPYELISKIGRGGFGEVWLAEKRTTLSTTNFALKLPNIEDVNIDIIRAEAEVWCSVTGHPNVLPIIEADIFDGQIVLASEYVKGGSLADWLKQHNGNAPTVDLAVQILRGILDGLEFLHSKKVLHRDLKPENILMQEGIPRLTDFGISKVLKDDNTSTQQVTGTIAYMPPEAFEGKRSFQTDLWSVGVIFYQMLSGKLPFGTKDYLAQMRSIVSDEPKSLDSKIPAVWQNFINRALAKERKQRFQTAGEMKKCFDAALRGETIEFKDEIEESFDENENLTKRQIFKNEILDDENPTIHQELQTINKEPLTRPLTTIENSGSKTDFRWIAVGGMVLLVGLIGIAMFMRSSPVQEANLPSNSEKAFQNTTVSSKKYLEMSASEKEQFVSAAADKILQSIKTGDESEITPEGKSAILTLVDNYAKRRHLETKDSCGSKTFKESDLRTVLKRGIKTAPDITTGFKEKEISPLIGIYIAMIESEFCPCLLSANGFGTLGIY